MPCFLGAGSYDHFIPAAVDAIASRSEFYSSYTPYQAEAGQGNLEALFEYQTLVTQLTGMDVSNSSLYDGGSAAAEAVLMALDATRRTGRVVVAESVHPEYRQILKTYLANFPTQIVTLETKDGTISPAALQATVSADTACVLVQHPNFFGCLEEVETLAEIAHKAGALFIVAVDPISLGLLKHRASTGPTSAWPKAKPWETPWPTADRTWALSPAASSSSAACPAALWAKPPTAAAGAAGSSPSKPANNTSAAKKPPATSAPTRPSSPSAPQSISP